MIRMIDALAERSGARRIVIAIMLGIVGLFLIGLTAGVVVAGIEQGALPRRLWVKLLALIAAPLGAMALLAAYRLAAPPQSASGYERRYWRMWILIFLLGIPVGMLFSAFGVTSGLNALNPFALTPLAPAVAIGLALLLIVSFVGSLILYHRAVDDHEERAYLWGSQVAYYFLILVFPAWWLLERGGLVDPISTGSAFVAILVSFVVQGAVWAWLKFR